MNNSFKMKLNHFLVKLKLLSATDKQDNQTSFMNKTSCQTQVIFSAQTGFIVETCVNEVNV